MFEFLKNLFGKAPLELEVSLDTGKNPPVEISNPDVDAGGRKIRWVRKAGETFAFESLNGLNQVYFNDQGINMNRTRIKCNNRAPNTGGTDKYPYEIIVKQGTDVYSSKKEGAPPDDKPVIRN
jgi:hypothetical protein